MTDTDTDRGREVVTDSTDEEDAKPRGRALLEWAVLVVAALVIAFVIKAFLFQAFYIPSESMDPTLKVHDRVLVNKLSYRFHDPQRGDIVVFTRPELEPVNIKDLVKRIVGLPGDTIEARNGAVYINGKKLSEPYLPKGTVTENLPRQVVPPDSYFVMGDNRTKSSDSRVFHAIKRSKIVGRVFMRIWPPSRIGFL